MHGGCNIALFSLDSPRPFSRHLRYFAATCWRMPSGGLVVCPGLACQIAFVPGIIHLCEMVCCSTVAGHGQACLHQGSGCSMMFGSASS